MYTQPRWLFGVSEVSCRKTRRPTYTVQVVKDEYQPHTCKQPEIPLLLELFFSYFELLLGHELCRSQAILAMSHLGLDHVDSPID